MSLLTDAPPVETLRTQLAVIGGGSAGFALASAAAFLGIPVVLVASAFGERHDDDGALLDLLRERARGGPHAPPLPLPRNEETPERLVALGAVVRHGTARFVGPDRLRAGGCGIHARRIVIATGAEAAPLEASEPIALPRIGLGDLIVRSDTPRALLVVGEGDAGAVVAQATARMGSKVTLAALPGFLAGMDPEAAALLRDRLRADGVTLLDTTRILGFDGNRARLETAEGERDVAFDAVFSSRPRRPALASLDLPAAGITARNGVLELEPSGRICGSQIFAAGGVTGPPFGAERSRRRAERVFRRAVLRLPARVEPEGPRVIATDPEFAGFGRPDFEAGDRLLRYPFSALDGAVRAGPAGSVSLRIGPRGHVRAATCLGEGARDHLAPLQLLAAKGLPLSALADLPLADGAAADAVRRLARLPRLERARSPLARGWLRLIGWLG